MGNKRWWLGCTAAVLLYLGLTSAAQAATTYYIRTDGGSDTQCTGKADAPYSGSGSNQACAYSHPFYVLSAAGSPNRMVGGDTMIIGPGQYMMGFGAPNSPSCSQYYPWDCSMRAVPSGTASNPTRILGKGYDTGCATKPQLWGTERSASVLDLRSSNNVQVQCLEITDHSSCIDSGPDLATKCNRNSYPYGPWAMIGIVASDSQNVLLKNVHIHGLRTGVLAGRLKDWYMENVDIIANSFIGWDGDIGSDVSSNSGTISFKNSKILWSGCGETYPGLQPHHCYSQDQGGYGDALGTHHTDGNWIFDHVDISKNVSDGIDLLYHTGNGSIKISHSRFEGNAGNQVKVAANTTIHNSKMIGNCAYFNGKSFTSTTGVGFNAVAFNNCRAGGNTVAVDFHPGMTLSIYNSTITGNGDVLIQSSGKSCLSTDKVISKNNIYIGGPEFNNGGEDKADLYYAAGAGGNGDGSCGAVPFSSSNDIIWGTKNNSAKCPSGSTSKCVDPKVIGPITYTGDNQDVSLQSSSPAIKAAAVVTNITNMDYNNYDRGASWDVGSLQYGSVPTPLPTGGGSTSPVCGNGILESGELCDSGNLNSQTCVTKGFAGGVLGCSNSCAFNTAACLTSLCGNGLVESGEQCDGSNMAGQTCLLNGFLGGSLSCTASCVLNTLGCLTSLCGNGYVEPPEQCDSLNLGGQTCTAQGFVGGTISCTNGCKLNTTACLSAVCGNGKIESSEQCDGGSLGGKTCASQGFAGGTLGCSSACAFNTTSCLKAVCGNGKVEEGEQCDGSNMAGNTCEASGFAGGTMGCSSSCTLNTAACLSSVCGNGKLEEGEQCDGASMAGQTCEANGFAGGTLGCSSSCTLNTSACKVAICGNGKIEKGEQCEGSNLQGMTCQRRGGFVGGTLKCTSKCLYTTAECLKSICGNGKIEEGEQCDGRALNNQTCEANGFAGGKISCSKCTLNTSSCLKSVCGNGKLEEGEQCDGSNLAGQSCEASGFAGGAMGCSSSCTINTTGCLTSICGNGKLEEGEQCDGSNMAGNTCEASGFAGGTMGCSSACTLNTTSCLKAVCGNGKIEEGEQCDSSNMNNQTCEANGFAGGSIGCSSSCSLNTTNCLANICGNGKKEASEMCDDGNTNSNDGCDSSCKAEYCGDGIKQSNEECEDGNTANGDGCSAVCKSEAPVCGNGKVDAGEKCDDGNATDNDGCSSTCKTEYCGDGVKQANEGCDDGNWVNSDGCSALCKSEVPVCGNGITEGTEKCDDGNATDNDGCSSTCRTEYCGDGVKQANEGCDDGNWVNRDGCSAVCKVETPVCGNWYREFGEQCDGDDMNGQSCTTQGFASGTLGCTRSCTFNTNSCVKAAPAASATGKFRTAEENMSTLTGGNNNSSSQGNKWSWWR